MSSKKAILFELYSLVSHLAFSLVPLPRGAQDRGKQKSTLRAPLESAQSAIKDVRKFQKQVELSCSPDLQSFWCREAEVSHGCQERF